MKINGIEEFELGDRSFQYRSERYDYAEVNGIAFTATVTKNSVNGIPTGTTYEAKLTIHMGRTKLSIEPVTGWLGRLKSAGMEAMQRAHSALSQLTFNYRLAPYEAQLEKTGFFEYEGVQFHKNGRLYYYGREIGSILNDDFGIRLAPFQMTFVRRTEGHLKRVIRSFVSKDITIDLTLNRDCLLYLLRQLYGLSWQGEFVPEKQVDRERLFYETVVRFGAMLAKVDGSADPSELIQLKQFFSIDESKLPGAARIFNEALDASISLEAVLGPFAKEFADAGELKEGFLVGMLSVALADGVFDRSEFDLIQKASLRLGMSAGAFERILAASGLSGWGSSGAKDKQRSSGDWKSEARAAQRNATQRDAHFRVLGLKEGVDHDQKTIRMAYRELVKRYHPDILRGQGMPEAEIEKTQVILVQINLAYEALTAEAA